MSEAKYEFRRVALETGETKSWQSNGATKSHNQKGRKVPFVMLYQEECKELALNEKLQGFDLRVFLFLVGVLDPENWVTIHHAQIARQMNATRQQVTRSVNRLVAEKIILKGTERTYRLNPGVGWKGDAVSQESAHRDLLAGKLTVVRP